MVAAGNEHVAGTGDGTRGGRGLTELADPAVPAQLAARIVDSMPMAFLALDEELRYRAINGQAEILLGRLRHEVIGKDVGDVFPPAIGQPFREEARRALTEQVHIEYEFYDAAADGWYENHLVPMEGGLWTFFRDVTKRKRAELRLEAQHAVTAALVESSTLSEATPSILQSLCRSLGWELAQLWAVDGENLRLVEAWRSPGVVAGPFSAVSRETQFDPGSGLPGRVWASGQPAWITDVTSDGNFPRAAAAQEEGLHSAAAFPIQLNGEVLGIIEFLTRATRQPDHQVLEMIGAVGAQIGQFIERTRAADAVRRSEARKSAIFESALDCVITMDHEGRIVEFNPAAEKMFGYAREDVVGEVMADLIVPYSLRRQHKLGLARYLETGEGPVLGTRLELTGLRSSGVEFPIELTVTRVDQPGAPMFTGYIRDITERRREQELSSRLAALVESSDDAIIGKDLESIITSWNAGAERLYGYRAEEVVGRSISLLMPPDRADEMSSIVDRLKRGESIDHVETVRVAKDGTLIDVSLTVSPIKDPAGLLVGASIIARNITERKRAEKERAELLAREQAARAGAERATRLLQRLQRVTDVALAHLELDDLLDELLNRTRDLLQADTATILLIEDNDTLAVRASSGLEGEVDAGVRVRIGEGITGRIAASRESVVVKDVSRVEVASPFLKHNLTSLIGAPLLNQNELLGVLYLGTFTYRDFTDEDLRLIELVAERVAQAIGNARSYESERAARAESEIGQGRLAFLAESSRLLASSLDYETTLSRVAQLAVPQIADWCTVDVLEEDGSIRPVALAHKDPEKVRWAEELQKRFPPDPDAPTGVPNVLRTGEPELYPEIPQELLAEVTDPGMLEIIDQLGMTSAMVVPLVARERSLGAISFVAAESGHHFDRADLAFAQELARRAAQAIDNARLFGEAHQKTEEVERLNEELERRVEERTGQLEEANQELEGFSYSVSHDLRAPLRVIDGFSRILLTEHGAELSEDAGRYLDMVRDGAQQMGQLIDDLLVYARLGRKSLEKQTVDPGQLARECLENLLRHQDDRQIEVDLGDLPPCEGDPVLLKQIILNLLDNALKYTRTRTEARIEVGCKDVDGEPVYFVRDNGVGFDMQYADKLFGVFQRMHKAEEYEGTGVGLAIVQRAVHRHGGKLWAESSVDEGAAFYFTLGGGTPVE
jgi:PAS domain S-box-containing protein